MVVYDLFWSAIKFHSESEVNFENSLTPYHTSSDHSRQLEQSPMHHPRPTIWPRRHSMISLLSLCWQRSRWARGQYWREESWDQDRVYLIGAGEHILRQGNKDASAHLQQLPELYSTIVIKGVTQDAIRLRLFSLSLLRRAKQWFYTIGSAMDTWENILRHSSQNSSRQVRRMPFMKEIRRWPCECTCLAIVE